MITSVQSRSTLAGSNSETGAAGGAACIDIVGFPQILYSRSLGDPDTFFVPLLDSAREAFARIELLCSRGESRENAVRLSGAGLATSLLREARFSLGARGLSPDNSYTVNLDGGTLHAMTRLFSVVSRRTSFFKVEIAGKISGGPYIVRNPVQGTVIMQVQEDRLRQPNFFASLAPECARAQMEQERFGRVDQALGPETNGEVRMLLNVGDEQIPVALRKKEAGSGWDIFDGRRQQWVGTLSSDIEEHLRTLTNFIRQLLGG